MRTRLPALCATLLFCALAAPHAAAQDPAKPAGPPGWVYPQDVKCAGRRLTLHEPQMLDYDATQGRASLRFPVMLTDPLGRSSFGQVECSGAVRLDFASRLFRLDTIQSGASAFPGVTEKDLPSVQAGLPEAFPTLMTFRLEILTARPVTAAPATVPAPKIQSEPVAIHVRFRPAVLMTIDGEPELLDVETFPLQYVTNTPSDVFRDAKNDLWYLLLDGSWAQAKALTGPWKRADSVPMVLSQIPATHPRGHIRRFVPGTPEYGKRTEKPVAKDPPEVLVSKVPAELMLIAGDPLFTWVPGVRLMSVANTDSDLFFHPKTNLYWLLVAGRWFSADEVEGPWKDTASPPEEFAKIPRDYVRGHVVWSVPGTPEASEACAQAVLEERATLNKFAQVEVLYEGKSPVKAPAEGGVEMVLNTEDDCFAVGKAFYVCQRGTWYRSDDGVSKWVACAEIPPELRKLPAKSGVSHVNFCRPLGFDGETASFAISAGYYGVFVGNGAPVYGTGSTRRGMMRNGNWYPAARTWGEHRWYDPQTGVFQARTVRPRADGTTRADEWSPYTASYGRVKLYGNRYDQGGRRMFPFTEDDGGHFITTAPRPDVYALWLSQVKKREGLLPAEFPLGDRTNEMEPAEPRLAAEASGKVWRAGAKGVEMFDKGSWSAGKCPLEVQAYLDTLTRIDTRPEQWKKWREQRAAPTPVNPVVTSRK